MSFDAKSEITRENGLYIVSYYNEYQCSTVNVAQA